MIGPKTGSGNPGVHAASLDALRGGSALVVLVAHAWQFFLGWNAVASAFAQAAVLVFFWLSGYVITQSLSANAQRNGGRISAWSYLSARARRIYPPLLGALALVWALHWAAPVGRLAHVSMDETWAALRLRSGLLSADSPLWSLYIEAHLYVLALAVGLALTSRRWRPLWAVVAALLLADAWMKFPRFPLCAAVWAAGAAWYGMGRGGRLPAPAVLVRAAGYSYSLYLTHVPLLLLASAGAYPGRTTAGAVAQALLAIAGCLAFAAAFARVLERPAKLCRHAAAMAPRVPESA